MTEYEELMQRVGRAAAAIFATASTEDEVCELERMIYDAINEAARKRMEQLRA